MKRYLLIAFVVVMLVSSFVSAVDYDYLYKSNTNVSLNRPATLNGASDSNIRCNLTVVNQYNGSVIVNNQRMTNNYPSPIQNISFTTPNEIGLFPSTMICTNGILNGTDTFNIKVTGSGNDDPSGAVVTFFFIGFLVILALFIYLFIYSFGHFLKKDMDLIDLAFDWGIYFVLLAFYILEQQYLGSPMMDSILGLFVTIGAFSHVLFSLIAFMFIMIYKSMIDNKKRMGING